MKYREAFSVTMESVDAVGIAFYAAYWIWYERAFEGFISVASGMSWREVLDSGLAIPIVHAEIDYVRPLRLSDQVTIDFGLARIGRRSVVFEAQFHNGEGQPVATAKTVHVPATKGQLEAAALPTWLASAFEQADNMTPPATGT